MTTISKLLKLGLPSSVAATGIVCLTMHLTNQANTTLNSLNFLDIDKRPDIKEEELKPIVPPPPPAAENPTNPTPDSPQSSGSPTSQTSSNATEIAQSQNKSSNAGGASSNQDIKEVIKRLMQEMKDKHTSWIAPKKNLGIFHEIVSRTSQLKIALENLSKLPQN